MWTNKQFFRCRAIDADHTAQGRRTKFCQGGEELFCPTHAKRALKFYPSLSDFPPPGHDLAPHFQFFLHARRKSRTELKKRSQEMTWRIKFMNGTICGSIQLEEFIFLNKKFSFHTFAWPWSNNQYLNFYSTRRTFVKSCHHHIKISWRDSDFSGNVDCWTIYPSFNIT